MGSDLAIQSGNLAWNRNSFSINRAERPRENPLNSAGGPGRRELFCLREKGEGSATARRRVPGGVSLSRIGWKTSKRQVYDN
jgi:hypothetical protein